MLEGLEVKLYLVKAKWGGEGGVAVCILRLDSARLLCRVHRETGHTHTHDKKTKSQTDKDEHTQTHEPPLGYEWVAGQRGVCGWGFASSTYAYCGLDSAGLPCRV